MKHNLDDKNRIEHILESIKDIETFLTNVSQEEFINDKLKRLAVERLLEIIGEATNHISDEILYKKDYSTPWRQIVATRNIITHEYFRVDYDVIYKIAINNIIPLKNEVESILRKLENSNK